MLRFNGQWLASVLALAIAITIVDRSIAQPPANKAKTDAQNAIEPRSGPGAGQKFLAKFVGQFDVEKSFFRRDGSESKVTGTCSQEMIHEGRFLKSEFTFDGPTGKTTGTGTIGYDTTTGTFTSVWIDSRSTRMSLRTSKGKFDGKMIVLTAAQIEGTPAGRQSRTETKLEDDGKKIIHTQFGIDQAGNERKVMSLVLTRKKSASK